MADETPTPATPAANPAPTPDEAANNTAASANPGAGTDPAQPNQAQVDITQSPEFKTALTKAIELKIPQLKRQIAKDITGEKEGGVTVEDLQRQLSERDQKLRAIEAKDAVRDYLSDARHKLNVKAENVAAIVKLVMPDIEYDEMGQPSNLKDAIETAKSLAPALFINQPGSINAGEGRNGAAPIGDMNSFIRQAAGHG